ncbi:hypothetical protein B7453_14600 [Pseudomonas sp. IB20]|nr:hypothetical protein B7453_14600 [Pseudomonas sp. IB20]
MMNGALGNTPINVGAGLPAIAVYQPMTRKLTHRYRRQASSHICLVQTSQHSFKPSRNRSAIFFSS